ncbi:phosphatases II [Plenodomus tracheiphilus IPT5]|uniref:Phosphatases II n=1 Tax=Plenodomus tracheiphilus IPT5 TaxID=1408161 RepID=A0A6A7B3F6_9PLEO|nr:phosphatases II [Plenodomus tracheiphilus IPT5]
MAAMREESAMTDSLDAYKRSYHEYSYRLPTPPRIVVPPPTMTTEMPGLAIGGTTDDLDMSFLRETGLENIVQTNTLLDWSYDRKRQAQMILPWLFLGPWVAAKDRAFMEGQGITMVLAIRAQPNSMMGAMNAVAQSGVEFAAIDAPSYFSLTGRLTETTTLINRHVARVRQQTLAQTGEKTLGKVLVFCESGNERSAAVVAAYLMETLDNFDYIKAMQVCQAQRFCVNFDDTIKNMLRSHWDILLARRSVATSLMPSPRSQYKRTIEHTRDDEDMDMDDAEDSDAARFVGRDVTPFQNA